MAYKEVKLESVPTEAQFWRFVNERQNIWKRRQDQLPRSSWTKDSILQQFCFCNVYREQDYGTQWAINNSLTATNLSRRFFHTVAYRCCNKPETFDRNGLPQFNKNWYKWWEKLISDESAGITLFSPAYRASAFGSTPRLEIYRRILDYTFMNSTGSRGIVARMRKAETLEEAHGEVCEIYGVGPFIAYEIVSDLMYTGFFPQCFTDNDWVHIGPGAQFLLKNFWNIKKKKDQMAYLYELRNAQLTSLPADFPWLRSPGDISLADIEGCCCEFRKWVSIKNGGGRPRHFTPSS